jgi:polyferredoxin
MDLLRLPVAGALTHRRTRLVLQLSVLAAAALLVLHGLLGPQLAPRNLATVVTWVHYRGLLILLILAVGNLFCAACPMILARDAGRRLVHPAIRWPRALRNKWPAIVLFGAVLFTYELFDLWSLPQATALLILAYFAAALLVDVIFAGASFCKYVCPVGQFNFVSSMLAPAELQVRDAGVCRSCRTVDCIKGRRAAQPDTAPVAVTLLRGRRGDDRGRSAAGARVAQRGCELALFLPGKVGNLDCTLCFDCVRACPHDNIGWQTRIPGDELTDSRRRSGIGRLPARIDLAALVVVFTFGALLNAGAMIAPAGAVQQTFATHLGTDREAVTLAALFLVGLVVLPLVSMSAVSWVTSLVMRYQHHARAVAVRYVYALVPLGFAVWVAHYGFHALTGAWTIIPVAQSAAIDVTGRAMLGEPLWTLTGMAPGTVYPLQLGAVLLGIIGALGVVYRLSARLHPARPALAALPWSVLILLLGILSAWIFSQPMDMRGVGIPG